MKTRVYITVDVEASVARSLNRYADGFRPLLDSFVACDVGGRSEGLGFLLRTLSRYGQTATFFVEAAQTQYFGAEPMGRYVEELLRAGQDVQLHVHPAWFNFRDGPPSPDPAERMSDDCADYTEAELTDLFAQCVEIFRGWTGRRPLRTAHGDLFLWSQRVSRHGELRDSVVLEYLRRHQRAKRARIPPPVRLDSGGGGVGVAGYLFPRPASGAIAQISSLADHRLLRVGVDGDVGSGTGAGHDGRGTAHASVRVCARIVARQSYA